MVNVIMGDSFLGCVKLFGFSCCYPIVFFRYKKPKIVDKCGLASLYGMV